MMDVERIEIYRFLFKLLRANNRILSCMPPFEKEMLTFFTTSDIVLQLISEKIKL